MIINEMETRSHETVETPSGDYVSPGLALVLPDAAFPEMRVGDTSIPRWPWLRRWVEHNWYTDRRNPDCGFASRDEASILYNNALMFRGKNCLEIGCWRGWSAVHIALASKTLDVIDPIFENPEFMESIRTSCDAAGVLPYMRFHAGFSPAAIDRLSQTYQKQWSFIFIDGEHEGEGPAQDAEAVLRNAAPDAMVLFHDLASPYVANGFHRMREAGWRTMVYQTMQIMGVAWRGNVEPVAHIPDPKVFWTLPRHLSGYEVSGWKRPTLRSDGAWWPGMSVEDRKQAAMMRAQAAEDDATAKLLECESHKVTVAASKAALDESMQVLARETAAREEAERLVTFLTTEQAMQRVLLLSHWLGQRHVLLGLLRRSSIERIKALRREASYLKKDLVINEQIIHMLLNRKILLSLFLMSKQRRTYLIERHLLQTLAVD